MALRAELPIAAAGKQAAVCGNSRRRLSPLVITGFPPPFVWFRGQQGQWSTDLGSCVIPSLAASLPTSLRFVGGVEDEEAVQEGKAPLGCSSPRGFQECFTCHAPSRRARLLPSHLDPLVVGGPHLWSRCGRGPLTRRGWFQNSCE